MEQESEIKLTEEAAKAINKAKDGAVSFGTSAGKTMKDWGSNAGSTVKNWGSNAGSTIKSWGRSIADFFGNAGQSIGKGWNGLVDKVKGKVSTLPGVVSFV